MSLAMKDKPQRVTLCDLCGDEIPERTRSEEVASVVKAYYPKATTPERVRWWQLLWNPRDWPGVSNTAWSGSPRWHYRQYDMHTECLIRMVEHSIALREES